MNNVLNDILAAEKTLAVAREETGDKEIDEVLRDLQTTPAVNNLGFLSLHAEGVVNTPLAKRFQAAAQGLIDFLESQGHGNTHKEADSIARLTPYYSIRVPEKFRRDPA